MPFADDIYKYNLLQKFNLIQISMKFCPEGCGYGYGNIGSDYGLASSRCRAIIWTNDAPVCWRTHCDRYIMMTSSNENIFCVTGLLCGEFTGHRWIPCTKASDAELWCFLWSAPKLTVEQTLETLVFGTPSSSLWRHCNDQIQLSQYITYNHNMITWPKKCCDNSRLNYSKSRICQVSYARWNILPCCTGAHVFLAFSCNLFHTNTDMRH